MNSLRQMFASAFNSPGVPNKYAPDLRNLIVRAKKREFMEKHFAEILKETAESSVCENGPLIYLLDALDCNIERPI